MGGGGGRRSSVIVGEGRGATSDISPLELSPKELMLCSDIEMGLAMEVVVGRGY